MKDPTRSKPNRVPTGKEPAVRAYAVWFGDVLHAFPSWVAYRLAAKGQALVKGREAGECRVCLANVTWPLGRRADRCPECGAVDPCPPSDALP